MFMDRMWINQPSKSQPYHSLHGTKVLALSLSVRTSRVWFLSGDVIDQLMESSALSPGWCENEGTVCQVPQGPA